MSKTLAYLIASAALIALGRGAAAPPEPPARSAEGVTTVAVPAGNAALPTAVPVRAPGGH